MTLFKSIRKTFNLSSRKKGIDPAKAYNIWAQQYDAQPDNLMLALESSVFTGLLRHTSLKDKVVADIGCGTGRHWEEILAHAPLNIYGYDVSIGMLAKLKEKYPSRDIYQLHDHLLPQLEDASCDMIISTLTIAHIKNIDEALTEWCRVLKPGGEIIITDYHPDALANNGDRAFVHKNKLISIKNYVHSLERLKTLLQQLGLEQVFSDERIIDDSVKSYYEKQNALHVFDKFKHTKIVYGMILSKNHGTA